jgi:rod shape-determining protein MreC
LRLQAFDALRGGMSLVLTPMRYTAELPTKISQAITDYFSSRQALLEEKMALEEQLLQQSVRISSLDFYVSQNNELRVLLDLKERLSGEWLVADVRRETSQLQSDRIYLDRGVNDGVLPGMTVVDRNGVVGQIVRADADNSAVNLLSHPRLWIAARVKRTGQLAIVRGTGGENMVVDSLASGANLRIGDELTADGGIFSVGYPECNQTRLSRGTLFIRAVIEHSSDFMAVARC